MESTVLTLHVSAKTRDQLEQLAVATKRSESYLAEEAIERYLALEAWQIKEINEALKEANDGDFVSEEELERTLKKYEG